MICQSRSWQPGRASQSSSWPVGSGAAGAAAAGCAPAFRTLSLSLSLEEVDYNVVC